MIRALIADDHAIVRDGLRLLFSHTDDLIIATEATCGEQVLELIGHSTPDLVILDVSMPGKSAIDTIRELHIRRPGLPVLILSTHDEPQIALSLIHAGASGYITKDSDPAQILVAIRTVAAGKSYIAPEMAEKIVFLQREPSHSELPHAKLSRREKQIFLMLANGKSHQEIADHLYISHKTVSSHKARIMQKMCFDSSIQLVRYAVMHGLAE